MIISVIVPTYKPGNYIQECLISLNRQTLDRSLYQVVLVLNGCDEPYRNEILSFIRANLPNLNVDFIQTNMPGVSNARNLGLQRAKGDYIAFVDDDDIISENYLEALLKAADSHIVSVSNIKCFINCISTSSDYYISQAFEEYKDKQQVNGFQMRKFLSSACGKLIPREVIDHYIFDTGLKNGEDSVFMLEISKNIHAMKCVPAIYYRRFREGSALTKHRSFGETTANYLHAFYRSLSLSFKQPLKYNHCLIGVKCLALLRSYVRALSRR